MAKRNRDEVPNPNSVVNRDILQRLNFLYQASQLLGSIAPSPPRYASPKSLAGDAKKKTSMREQNKRRHPTTCADLSRSYVKSMKAIGQKTNVRMDPAVKRTLCKGCDAVLVPGVTAKVRVKSSASHGHAVSYTCTACNTLRRIPAPPVLDPAASTASDVLEIQPLCSEADDANAMSVDKSQELADDPSQLVRGGSRRKKKPPVPRPPPFFERNVGHVVFRGNERLVEEGLSSR